MIREELTEKILDIKREKGWTWKYITDEIGGMSDVLIVGALLGQMKLVKPLAKKAATLFGLVQPAVRLAASTCSPVLPKRRSRVR